MIAAVIPILVGPAPAAVTDHIYTLTKDITEYHICPEVQVDITKIGSQEFPVQDQVFRVEVIDTVLDYSNYMKEIFDFSSIKDLLTGDRKINILVNALHGGTNLH